MPGYRYLSGNTTLTCNDAGHWNGEMLICEVITCTETNNSNVEILYQNLSIGGTANYKCIPGSYYEEGNLNRTCTIEGEWNGDPPVCKQCTCPCGMIGSMPIKEYEIDKLHQRLEELKLNLRILKNTTSRAIRNRISATDVRPSAVGVGTVLGAGILVAVFGSIGISDLPRLWSILFRRGKI
ncbi:CUB and sushi domain-containing protein 3-like [Saccostrea cucullata]|uniref:CUB and sushi domain-containing protein 3-like n=1 Tax=Saccostrea cuccullata TaxID=36930 RepID=UPI002ED14AE5